MRLESRAIFLYRHPLNRLVSKEIPAEIITDRNLREAEKSIVRVLRFWMGLFRGFHPGIIVPSGEQSSRDAQTPGKDLEISLSLPTQKKNLP